jgi:hypothetical protein
MERLVWPKQSQVYSLEVSERNHLHDVPTYMSPVRPLCLGHGCAIDILRLAM